MFNKMVKAAVLTTMALASSYLSATPHDSSVSSSVVGDGYFFEDTLVYEARVSHCRSSTWHYVKMGERLKPSGRCRVINYYGKDMDFLGATNVPLDVSYRVKWHPEVGAKK